MFDFLNLHFVIMLAGGIFYLITSLFGFLDKGDRKIDLHMYLGAITGIFYIFGIFHLIMSQRVYPFFTHFYLGILFLLLLVISLLLGVIYKSKNTKNKVFIRRLHKIITALGFVILVITMVVGIKLSF